MRDYHRHYTTDDRFHVTCSLCGFLCGESSLYNAKRAAQTAEINHNTESEHIEIYDSMAHIGKPDLYNAYGEVIQIRES